jgi:hypothetical protein
MKIVRTAAGERLRRAPAGRPESHRRAAAALVIIVLLVFGGLIYFASSSSSSGGSAAPSTGILNQIEGIASGIGSAISNLVRGFSQNLPGVSNTVTTSSLQGVFRSETWNYSQPPLRLVSVYDTYATNQAVGDSEYTGKTVDISALSSGGVQKDQDGNYVTLNTFCSGTPCSENGGVGGAALFTWENQETATQVPTAGMMFIAQCQVGGIQHPDSSGQFDGFQLLFNIPILVLNSCVIPIGLSSPSVSCTLNGVATGDVLFAIAQSSGVAQKGNVSITDTAQDSFSYFSDWSWGMGGGYANTSGSGTVTLTLTVRNSGAGLALFCYDLSGVRNTPTMSEGSGMGNSLSVESLPVSNGSGIIGFYYSYPSQPAFSAGTDFILANGTPIAGAAGNYVGSEFSSSVSGYTSCPITTSVSQGWNGVCFVFNSASTTTSSGVSIASTTITETAKTTATNTISTSLTGVQITAIHLIASDFASTNNNTSFTCAEFFTGTHSYVGLTNYGSQNLTVSSVSVQITQGSAEYYMVFHPSASCPLPGRQSTTVLFPADSRFLDVTTGESFGVIVNLSDGSTVESTGTFS